MPELSELQGLIPSRAITVLEEHGATVDELAVYSIEDLEAIKGIGRKWAIDIRESLSLLRPDIRPPDESPAADESLLPGYFTPLDDDALSDIETIEAIETLDSSAITAIYPQDVDAPSFVPPDETALQMALRYLRECGREADAADVAVLAQSSEVLAVGRAIDILEGLPGGALPKNLAQDVRVQAEMSISRPAPESA